MVTRPGQPNEVNAGKDNPVGNTGEAKVEPFQGESPFQSKDGLTQVRGVADRTDQQVPGVPEVSWTTNVAQISDAQKTPLENASGKNELNKAAVGDQLSGMILKNADGSPRSLESIRQSNPKLAAQIDKAAEILAQKSPENQSETLRIMKEMYKGLDPRSTDNRESKQALERAKRNPEYVLGAMNKAEELMKQSPQKREQEIKNIKVQLRTFYLDGGNL